MSDKQPGFGRLVLSDARATIAMRGETARTTGVLRAARQITRLCVVTDAFFGQVCYRAASRLRHRHIPLLPHVFHRLAMMTAQICIGPPVTVGPGLYVAHGQVVVDGITSLGSNVVLFPFVTIGLKAGKLKGPTIGDHVHVGTGAKIIGPVRVGRNSLIGANAVVVDDVPRRSLAMGVPAVVSSR